MAGVRFPQSRIADIFLKDVLDNVERMETKMNKELSFNHPRSDGAVRGERRNDSPRKKILKAEISRPCMFTHVTSAIEVKKDEVVKKVAKFNKSKSK